jgi:hypothetical protein
MAHSKAACRERVRGSFVPVGFVDKTAETKEAQAGTSQNVALTLQWTPDP